MRIKNNINYWALCCLVLLLSQAATGLQPSVAGDELPGNILNKTTPDTLPYVANRIIVKFKENYQQNTVQSFHSTFGAKVVYNSPVQSGLQIVKLPPNSDVIKIVEEYKNNPNVLYAEPDYRYEIEATIPDDESFTELWALNNTGQTGGTPDADINAPEAWDITQGSADVVVAVIDTGIDYTHVDLVDNIWSNPGEIAGNGIDDDLNGYVDDVHGIDAADMDSDPMDAYFHGTHVAGTIGARGNNAKGVVGVNWNIKIIACKMFARDEFGLFGSTSAAVECLDYIYDLKVNHGINIVATNNSWGSYGVSSQVLEDAIRTHADAGILFVASAGNSALNTDDLPHYPSGYYLPNVISVAASDHNDQKAFFSNWGKRTVHVAAPGYGILSSVPGGAKQPPANNPHSNIFLEDVENIVSGWIAQTPWATANQAYNGAVSWQDSPAGDYANNLDAALTSPVIDLSTYSAQDVYLGFYANYAIETGFDQLYVEASGNNGVTWQTIANLTGTSESWQFLSYLVPPALKTSLFQLRFRLQTDELITKDGVSIDDIGLGTDPYIPATTGSQDYLSVGGTSMAAPHVTGLLGLIQASDISLPWYELRNLLLSSGTNVADFQGRTVSGKRIRAADSDGTGALTCSGQNLLALLKPMKDTIAISENQTLQIAVLNINCGKPAGDVSLSIAESDEVITLLDDGLGFDQVAGDGIYSAQVDISQYGIGQLNMELPDSSTFQVNVIKNYLPALNTDYQWREIAPVGSQLLIGADDDTAYITSPFLINFGNDLGGYKEVGVTSNGFISLLRENENAFVIPYTGGMTLPTEEFSNIIAPYWDDLVVFDIGTVYWAVLGEAPDRELVIQWQDVGAFSSEGNITFQVVFFENSADILFNYQDVLFGDVNVDNDSGLSATVGVQVSSVDAQQYSYDTASLDNETSLLWMVENTPPAISVNNDITLIEGGAVNFVVEVSDANAFPPILSVENLPANASFDVLSGEFDWPDVTTPGVYEVTFIATDAVDPGLTESRSVVITVEENIAPEFELQEDIVATAGDTVTFTMDAVDANGTPVYMSVSGLPPGANFNSDTGLFEWAVGNNTGEYSVLFVAIDSVDFDLIDTQVVTISVNEKGGGGLSWWMLALLCFIPFIRGGQLRNRSICH